MASSVSSLPLSAALVGSAATTRTGTACQLPKIAVLLVSPSLDARDGQMAHSIHHLLLRLACGYASLALCRQRMALLLLHAGLPRKIRQSTLVRGVQVNTPAASDHHDRLTDLPVSPHVTQGAWRAHVSPLPLK